jgi:MFS family permease
MASALHTRTGTFSALRHGNFRLYFGGQFIAISGMWMQTVALGWLVYFLTRSELWLGLVACAAGLPALLLSPFAGVVADRFRRRDILLFTQTIEMVLAFVLAWLTLVGLVQVWHVILLAFIEGSVRALDGPARQAFIKDMVGAEDLSSGITLNAIMINGGRIVGPAFAGLLLGTVGAGWCFLLRGVATLAVLTSLLVMHLPPRIRQIQSASPLTQIREGWHFARGHEVIAPLILLSAVTSVFAINVITVLPSFAATVLNSPINGYSVLSMVQGVGAILAGLALGLLTGQVGRGRFIMWMAVLTSVVLFALSRTTQVPPAALLMGLTGFCFVGFFVATNTALQDVVPDEFRGRVMSLFTLTFLGLTPFGALALGMIAERAGTSDALALYALLNGLLCLVILLRWPGLRAVK